MSLLPPHQKLSECAGLDEDDNGGVNEEPVCVIRCCCCESTSDDGSIRVLDRFEVAVVVVVVVAAEEEVEEAELESFTPTRLVSSFALSFFVGEPSMNILILSALLLSKI
mmetsp:Transcript_35830/g.50770  ORF Transcript_35830/g.50770 Transcript_35830/m.50770 type:complete len:110 (-) Transcript_35830:85-414(-)|eukprot:CAMPEP_0202479752 /NCGR_PEP_ID=MMETSP1360-20130828/95150_1 /ASSEMBLY_ACC=CAM_ASM_000848 /TAXON_ID=515479 /ORGANISM="Licmophora paradoxa, Strain CCMP2313" /LENGTH=109 /DNA_ID=CAMNT_0049107101 /DNA_START=737 /DNA_END=1066 /DNA_ORIENTATION=-